MIVASYLGLGIGLFAFVVLLLLLIAVFEIWMLVSAITNKFIDDTAKILWVIGMVLVHPIVAIVYYFTDYQKTKV